MFHRRLASIAVTGIVLWLAHETHAQPMVAPSLHAMAPPETGLDDGSGMADGEFKARVRELDLQRREAAKLLASNTSAYVKAMRAYLGGAEALIERYPASKRSSDARTQLAGYYLNLGHIARFKLKRPSEAIELYEAARRAGSRAGGLAIADLYQFDVGDAKRAAGQYRKVLATVPDMQSSGEPSSSFAPWLGRWIEAQVRYLETGARFTGRLTQDDTRVAGLVGAGMISVPEEVFDFGSAMRKVDKSKPGEIAQVLSELPPSTVALLASSAYLFLLPDSGSILAFLQRHDPAGFASACLFMIVEMQELEGRKPSDAMSEAKSRFLAERKVDTGWIREAMSAGKARGAIR